jgi:hypothetical protein
MYKAMLHETRRKQLTPFTPPEGENKMRISKVLLLVMCLSFALFFAQSASADTITYTLNNSNLGSSFTGPFATVQVNLTSSTTATITFTAGTGYVLMDSSIADANVNATSWSISGFSFACGGAGCNGGSGQVNGFGVFNQTTNAFGGYGDALSTVNFTITDTSGTWANAASVLAPNSQGGHAAVHVAPTSLGGACTGFASDATEAPGSGTATGCTATGEPSTLLGLLGAGLIGLPFMRRKLIA